MAKKNTATTKPDSKSPRRMGRTGPIQLDSAVSVNQIVVGDYTLIKRHTLNEGKLLSGKGGEMPPRRVVEHALYVCPVTLDPVLAAKVRMTPMDFAVFGLLWRNSNVFAFTRSTSRPASSMRVVHFWWGEHDSILGDFNEFDFWDKLRPASSLDCASTSLADYTIPTPESSGLASKNKIVDLANDDVPVGTKIKRGTGLLIVEVRNGNPNGDPDTEGRPRVQSDNRGWISDVSLKSRLRQLMADHTSDFFQAVQEKLGFDPEQFHVYESLRRGTNGYAAGDYENFTGSAALQAKKDVVDLSENNPEGFLGKFWDVRMFGVNLLENKEKAEAEE